MTQVTGNVTATHLTYGGWEYLPNGDFESGFGNWSYYCDGGTASVSTATYYSSGHSAKIESGTQYPGYGGIQADEITLISDTSLIEYYYYVATCTGTCRFQIYEEVTDDVIYSYAIESVTDGFVSATFDLGDYGFVTGNTLKLTFLTRVYGGAYSGGDLTVYLDDVKINSALTVATIEDNRKTWTADQFNTDGMFILTSGDVKGYSCTILDTFENYIQVPTTFANIINNITSQATNVISNGDFELGDFTNWAISYPPDLSWVSVGTEYAYLGTYGASLWCDDEDGGALFYTTNGASDVWYISFYYKFATYATTDQIGFYINYCSGWPYDFKTFITAEDGEWHNFATILTGELHDFVVVAIGNALGTNVFFDNITATNSITGDTYLITYTPTAWVTATATVFTFSSECGKNATTLGNINYGDGGLTLEFVENIGTYTGLTWTINKDVFFADVNQDYSRIASVIRGKGSKLCGGAVYSYIADNTYSLTVSTIGDTFLRAAATAGANKIYVYDNTHFGTAYGYGSNFSLIVGHGETQEWLEISATGANGECTILPYGTTSYAHSVLEDVMNQGCFYATGSKEEVDNFMLALENTWMGYNWQNLSVFIGSEIVYLNCDNGTPYVRLNDNTVKMFMETLWRDDSYGYAYPHAPGAPVVAAVYFGGGLQNPDSLMARYGYRDAHVNPVGIVDPDSLDKLCYNSLMSGTANGTWGKVMMPATLLPATVDIGDWVNIEEADQSATACYQIVGLEYDQSKGRFWIELGSTEDYYLESIAGNRGTFDLSLSNY